MPSPRTDLTEIITGLGAMGFAEMDEVLAARPRGLVGVDDATFRRVGELAASDAGRALAQLAWANGEAFAQSPLGLRGRPPRRVEWKGPHKPPAYEQIPADLRIDDVYLVSCKYGSHILHNASPAHLFSRGLDGTSAGSDADWYETVCGDVYDLLWTATRDWLATAHAIADLPHDPRLLDAARRHEVRSGLPERAWPAELAETWAYFAQGAAIRSADHWKTQMPTKAAREQMAWRLLRLQAAPYFVLGSAGGDRPLRYRVNTPWDFRSRFEFRGLDVAAPARGQPVVTFCVSVRDRESGLDRVAEGHVEVRWSHGKFGGRPEAKVYLDTPHHEVPGYSPLAEDGAP